MESRDRLALIRDRLAREEAGRAAYCETLTLVLHTNQDHLRLLALAGDTESATPNGARSAAAN